MAKFVILSVDGGGVRGIVPIRILQYIEKRTNKKIFQSFDLIAGTSTGAFIACGITLSQDGVSPKYTLEDIANLYLKRSKEIFPPQQGVKKISNSISSLWLPQYPVKGLDKVLRDFLGTARMTDCLRPLIISSYDILNNQCLFFKTRHALESPMANAHLYDICRATSAAPTYLPAYSFRFDNQDVTCIDGGTFINNPALGAAVEVNKYKHCKPYNLNELQWDEIYVLSLGTGRYKGRITEKPNVSWGKLRWIRRIINIMMYGVNETTDYEMQELIEDGNYIRIGVDIEDEQFSDMANSSDESMQYLEQAVNDQILHNATQLEELDDFMKKAGLM